MPNCSNCGKSLEDKPKICPQCGRPTRIYSPGMLGNSGFELLIGGILCLAVIAFMLYREFAGARVVSKRILVTSQCKNVGIAMSGYLSDNDDRYPPMKSSGAVEKLIDKYLKHPDELKTRDFAMKGTWNSRLSLVPSTAINDSNEVWLFYSDRKSDPGFAGIFYSDGHAKFANQFVYNKAMTKKLEIDESFLQKPTKTK